MGDYLRNDPAKKIDPSSVIDKNLKSIHDNPIKTGHVQREFHGMPAGRHESLAVGSRFSSWCQASFTF